MTNRQTAVVVSDVSDGGRKPSSLRYTPFFTSLLLSYSSLTRLSRSSPTHPTQAMPSYGFLNENSRKCVGPVSDYSKPPPFYQSGRQSTASQLTVNKPKPIQPI